MIGERLSFLTTVVSALAVAWTTTADAASPTPIGAEHGMVVSAHRLASKAGIDVLKAGGNAVDAAVAVGYALAVTFPEAGNLGGGGFMTIRFHDGRTAFIDFRETAPAAATATMYLDANGNPVPARSRRGYLAVGVPGTVAGLELARTKYGTRAARRADGQRDPAGARRLRARPGRCRHACRRRRRIPQGRAQRRDLPQPAASRGSRASGWSRATSRARCRAIAKGGPTAFYKGPIAAKIVAASKAGGGILATRRFRRSTGRASSSRSSAIIAAIT